MWQFSLPQMFRWKRAILPKTAQNEYSCDTFNKLILAFIDIIHRCPQNFLILLKRLKFHECASEFQNDLYMAHHNLLGICQQLKICHLYGTFNFLTQCICMGTRQLVCLWFSSFLWKGAPSTKENWICGSENCLICQGPDNSLMLASERSSLGPLWNVTRNVIEPKAGDHQPHQITDQMTIHLMKTWAHLVFTSLPSKGLGGGGGGGGIYFMSMNSTICP